MGIQIEPFDYDKMLTEPSPRPLFTFIVLAYNQENYIHEAVKGALSQIYEPLEIIFSDDCSKDRTYEIIEELVQKYSGPHLIRLNHNEKNLGIGAHVSKLHKIANGQIIIHAAGDDISLPERTKKIYEAWVTSPIKPSLFISNCVRIDKLGKELTTLVASNKPSTYCRVNNPLKNPLPMLGCTVAVDRKLTENFSEIIDGVMAEDVVLYRRAHLCNGIFYIPDILVKYRCNAGGVSQLEEKLRDDYLKLQIKWTEDRFLRLDQIRLDIEHIESEYKKEILKEIYNQECSEKRRLNILKGSFLVGVGAIISESIFSKKWNRYKVIAKDFIIRWMPSILGYK